MTELLLKQAKDLRAALIEHGFLTTGSTYLKAFDAVIIRLQKAVLKGVQ